LVATAIPGPAAAAVVDAAVLCVGVLAAVEALELLELLLPHPASSTAVAAPAAPRARVRLTVAS
jgi:hypothetical protein